LACKLTSLGVFALIRAISSLSEIKPCSVQNIELQPKRSKHEPKIVKSGPLSDDSECRNCSDQQERSARSDGVTALGLLLAMEGDTMLAKILGRLRDRQHSRKAWMASAALAALSISTGCQVEYAGMTLPSGKYFHDDVQYFNPGPKFPYANTMAATQRARMKAMGIDVPAPTGGRVITPPVPPGDIDPEANAPGNFRDDINPGPLPGGRGDIPAAPVPGGGFSEF